MSDPHAGASNDDGGKENSVAKTARILVFSGIALSILKALNPFNKDANEARSVVESIQPPIQSVPVQQPSQSLPPPEPIIKKPIACMEQKVVEKGPEVSSSAVRTIEIVKGDTLWGLSRKYGVSIDAIKEANGLNGDTIYSGKKLIIP